MKEPTTVKQAKQLTKEEIAKLTPEESIKYLENLLHDIADPTGKIRLHKACIDIVSGRW